MNLFVVRGHLGKDAETKNTKSGSTVTRLSLAESVQDRGQKSTQWHNLVIFNSDSERWSKLMQYLTKGKHIEICGRVKYDSYQNNKGETVRTTEIVVNNIEFVPGSGNGNGNGQRAEEAPVEQAAGDNGDSSYTDAFPI